jgi:hypothetical protein
MNSLKLTKLNLLLAGIIAFSLISCSPSYIQNFTKNENLNIKSLNVFYHTFTKAVYKTTLKVMGREMSGILLIKKTNNQEFRFVFMSEIGLKYFDLGITNPGKNPDYKNYYLMSVFNRGEFKKVLFDNFNTLSTEIEIDSNFTSYSNLGNKSLAVRENNTKEKTTYLTINETVENIYWKSPYAGKSNISISKYENNIPQNIEINNKKYGVKIICKQLEKK